MRAVRVIVLLALIACLVGPVDASVAAYKEGTALLYAPGVMERTYQTRIRQGLVKAGWQGGLAATPDCKNIGKVIQAAFLNPKTGKWTAYQSMLIVDCAMPGDYKGLVRRGIVVEVGYPTAVSTGWNREGKTKARLK